MSKGRRVQTRTGLVLVLSLCMFSTGCGLFTSSRSSTSNRPAQVANQVPHEPAREHAKSATARAAFTPLVIEPRQELFWTLEATQMPPNSSMNGKALVGPDGTIVLGPYGTFQVANMTVEQARAVIEKQIAAYVQNPKVTLTIVSAATAATTDRESKGVASSWHDVERSAATTPPITIRATNAVDASPPSANPDTIDTVAWRPVRKTPTESADSMGAELAPLPRTMAPSGVEVTAHSGPHAGPRKQKHGAAPVAQAPRENSMMTLPPYVIGPPDILQIDSLKGLKTQEVRGAHLVRPDGSIGLGVYGSVPVAGLTIDQAKDAVARAIHARLDPNVVKLDAVLENLSVDVLAYNSKVYYVITDRVGLGEVVERLPVTGNETVLDAISQVKGLPPEVSKRRIWVARRSLDGHQEQVLPVDWIAITQRGNSETNYQVLPGDRIYVQGDKLRHIDNVFGKIFAPIERILGGTLLGSQAVNSIRSGATFGFGGIR
jgi:polysaccharide export outer membrane protein